MWAYEEHFFCEAPRPNRPDDPPIEPTRIFDDVYAIGNQGTVAYVINTSDGLLMLDSLRPIKRRRSFCRDFKSWVWIRRK